MKTRIFTLLALLFAGVSAIYAQTIAPEEEVGQDVTIETIPDAPGVYPWQLKTVIWGIKGNIGATLPYANWMRDGEKQRMFNSGFGASLGAIANIYLGRNFYFEPELALSYEGYTYDNFVQVAPNSPSVNGGPNIHKLGVNLPLLFGYFINISDTWGLDVFTGPELGCTFYGTARTQNEAIKENYNLMNVFKGEYAQNRVGLGWKVGIGFPVNNFLISVEGDFGITDMMKEHYTLRENSVSLGITYYFVGD